MKNMIIRISYSVLVTFFFANISNAQWGINGNSGTNPPTNFLGTTDNKGLVFKTNSTERMRIGSTGKVGIGVTSPAYKLDVAGDINISTGKFLRINGIPVFKDNFSSVSIGENAGATNGTNNVAVGIYSMFSNTGGYTNTAIGNYSLYSNKTGFQNFAAGCDALYSSVTANSNTAVGFYALYSTTAGYNTAVGAFALLNNTGGTGNCALGSDALHANTTGNENVSFGSSSLYASTSGFGNAAMGGLSLFANISGSYNVAFGYQAGYTADNNNCTFIGALAENNSATGWTNSTALGYQTYISASNQVRIGNSAVSSIGGGVNWSMVSDQRVKKNIQENIPGLEFINKLQPVTYNLNLDAMDQFMNQNKNRPEPSSEELKAKAEKEKILYSGFIAQDVEKAAKDIGYDFSGVDAPKNDQDLYGLRYAEFVVPLVKAVQELSGENDELKTKNAELEKRISALENQSSMNDDLAKSKTLNSPGPNPSEKPETILGQNIPNPFDNSTLIPFRIPKDCHDASIMISITSTSEVVSIIPVSCNDDHVSIHAGVLASGTYSYTLYVDGKMIDTKEMVLTK